MSRLNWIVVAVALASGAAGCAQCDTCDDFPAPCTGPNCGYPYNAGAGAGGPTYEAAPQYVDSSMSMSPPASPATMAPGASLAPAAAADSVPKPSLPTPPVNPAPGGAR